MRDRERKRKRYHLASNGDDRQITHSTGVGVTLDSPTLSLSLSINSGGDISDDVFIVTVRGKRKSHVDATDWFLPCNAL